MRRRATIVTPMLVSDPATAARRRFGADLTLPTEGRPATQVAAGSLENPKDRIFRGLGSRLIHEAGTVTGEARTLGVFLGSSARSARFSDRASRAPLLSGPFDLFFRLAFPSGIFIGPFFIAQDQRCRLIHRCEHNSSLDSVLCVSVCVCACARGDGASFVYVCVCVCVCVCAD